jgi:hypothetical protein
MKSLLKALPVKAVAILFAVGLMICFAEAWAADWKEFAEATTGVFSYDRSDVRSPAPGLIRVWIHNVTKKETSFLELNCREKKYRVLDVIQYDAAGGIGSRETYYDNPNPTWYGIEPISVPAPLQSLLCQ